MPIDDIKLPKLYYLTKGGKLVPISKLTEVNFDTTCLDEDLDMKTLLDIHEFSIVLRYRRHSFPAELRFPKKHRRQASIDRKKRKERRRRNNEQRRLFPHPQKNPGLLDMDVRRTV